MAKKSSKSGGFGKIFLGFLLGVAAVAAGLFAYLSFGALPVAVADTPFPFEKQIVHVPLGSRIDREMKSSPFGISEDVFESGAQYTGSSVRLATAPLGTTFPTQSICFRTLRNFGRHTAATG